MKSVAWKIIQALFNFQGSLYKKESQEVNVLIRTDFDNFANTYLI